MYIFCNKINNALKQNYIFLDLCFKKKYIDVLYKLLDLNLIKSFSFNKKSIRIFFRYYNNKPIFLINNEILPSRKQFFKIKKICKKKEISSMDLFSTSINLSTINSKDFLLLKNIGGLKIIKVNLLFD